MADKILVHAAIRLSAITLLTPGEFEGVTSQPKITTVMHIHYSSSNDVSTYGEKKQDYAIV